MAGLLKYSLYISSLLLLSAADALALPLQDNGTSTDGTMIFPKKMALFCGISSHDIKKTDALKNCMDKMLELKLGTQQFKENYSELFKEAYHQMNSYYLDEALNKKSVAGDYEQQIDKNIDEELSLDGALPSKEDAINKKQEQLAKLSGMMAQNTADLLDVYTSQMALNSMQYFYEYEFSDRAAPIGEDEE